jgi:hypothetical protein
MSRSSLFPSRGRRAPLRRPVLLLATLVLLASPVSTQTPHFYSDDPIAREPESQDATHAQAYEIESLHEMTHNLFVTAAYRPSGTRA